MCMCVICSVCMTVGMCLQHQACRGQRTTSECQLSPSTLGLKADLQLSGCAVWWLILVVNLTTSRINYNPELEGSPVIQILRFLTWILAWRSWGIVAMRILGPGKVGQVFNPRRLRQGYLWVQSLPGTKQILDSGMVVYTFNLGHTFSWRPM